MSDNCNLRQWLDVAYAASRYRRPTVLYASLLRNPEKLLGQLTAKPIRLLDVEEVQEYASAALTTIGTIEDYKHFLPRLLDLATASGAVEPEMISLKLNMAEWRAWPKNEQLALEEVFVYACIDAFDKHTDDYLAGGWLVSLAMLGMDLDHVQTNVLTSSNYCCALQLAYLLLSGALFASDPSDRAYWRYVPETTMEEMRIWLLSEKTRSLLLFSSIRAPAKDAWLLEKAIARHEELIQQRLH